MEIEHWTCTYFYNHCSLRSVFFFGLIKKIQIRLAKTVLIFYYYKLHRLFALMMYRSIPLFYWVDCVQGLVYGIWIPLRIAYGMVCWYNQIHIRCYKIILDTMRDASLKISSPTDREYHCLPSFHGPIWIVCPMPKKYLFNKC